MTKRLLVALMLLPVPTMLLVHCGSSSSGKSGTADGGPTPTATTTNTSPPGQDSAPPPPDDAGADTGTDAARYCDLGLARGDSTGGTVTLFDKEGNPLPAGRYRLTYANGCMIYGGGQPYTVHAYEPSVDAATYATWMLVIEDGGFQPVKLPGNWLFGADAAAAPADYTACVAANKMLAPVEFEYDAGARLGVQINDNPLGDNVPGPDGGDPTWRLERYSPTGACP